MKYEIILQIVIKQTTEYTVISTVILMINIISVTLFYAYNDNRKYVYYTSTISTTNNNKKSSARHVINKL